MNTHMATPKSRKSSFQSVWNLETGWKLELIKNNELGLNLVSNWKLELETWKLAETPLFVRVTGQIPVSSLSPTPNGVVGIHHRLRLVTPTSAIGTNNQPIQNRVAMHPTKSEQDRRSSRAAKARTAIATLTTQQAMERRYA